MALIEQKTAVSAISDLLMHQLNGERFPTYNEVYHAIHDLTPVDAVPVVRCKDCKYWDTVSGSTFAPTHHQCQIINLMSIGTWYCASGERKDGKDGNDENA